MLSYCLKCRKNTESIAVKNTIMLLSKCEVLDSKKIKIYQRAKS